ncbi:hypothetical protein [Pedobacter sp. GR22-6]|uniref:hypothetical protein n=1 Tax=Pedobacter sp. GR22-6 TaxID=3127957 RepID=UPI00307F0656
MKKQLLYTLLINLAFALVIFNPDLFHFAMHKGYDPKSKNIERPLNFLIFSTFTENLAVSEGLGNGQVREYKYTNKYLGILRIFIPVGKQKIGS